jgi:hypothetical protein
MIIFSGAKNQSSQTSSRVARRDSDLLAGLPDWYNIPKREKFAKMTTKYTK